MYRYQLRKAPELSEWSKNWKPRGDRRPGPVQARPRHRPQCLGRRRPRQHVPHHINPDGSVAVEMGSQDLGTGTRTIMTQVAAETLGLPMGADQAGDRRQLAASRGRFGRIDHGRRRLLVHAQSRRERAGETVRSGGAGAGRAARATGSGGRP